MRPAIQKRSQKQTLAQDFHETLTHAENMGCAPSLSALLFQLVKCYQTKCKCNGSVGLQLSHFQSLYTYLTQCIHTPYMQELTQWLCVHMATYSQLKVHRATLLDEGGWRKVQFGHVPAAFLRSVGAVLVHSNPQGESRLLERVYGLHAAGHHFVAITNNAMMRKRDMRGIKNVL